jgi:sulfonate transport system ATP-binding protein
MLRLDHLSKTYADGTQALSAITLSVGAGEILGVVGGSGCGKTTLLRLIAGLDQASAGTVSVAGEVILKPHPAVGIVFQEPRLLPWLSVAENVGFGLSDLSIRERADRVAHALDRVGLAGQGRRWPRELSGGQQQRVSIARALVARPKVLLLDEPFSALDAFTRASLHEHLLLLWDETKPTVVMVTHDVEEAITLSDRVVVMRPRPGRVFETVTVGLDRPRDKLAVGFDKAKRRVLNALDRSLRVEERKPTATDAAETSLWW